MDDPLNNKRLADLASADLLEQVACLERGGEGLAELVVAVDDCEPEAERRRVVVARPDTVTLDERGRTKGLEARPGGVEGLSRALRTGTRVLQHTADIFNSLLSRPPTPMLPMLSM